MNETNYSFNVFDKIQVSDRPKWKLFIDAVYKADPNKKNLSGEVLSKLLGIKNQGGFRYLGKTDSPKLIVLFTSGEDVYWRDELDTSLGLLLYYGDNKTPGTDLHVTKLHGNELLRYIFDLSASNDVNVRKMIPPILVFKKAGGRDVKFLGLAVPGISGKPQKEWLTAVWGCNKNGDRFQNYRALFTILNTSSGDGVEKGFGINLAWITDIESGRAFDSQYAPKEWKKFIMQQRYSPLFARVESSVKTKEEQMPDSYEKWAILRTVHDYFIQKDHGYGFELFARDMAETIDQSVVDLVVTRPYKDGGIDAEGKYKIFRNADHAVYVDFYLQAKCYKDNHGVSVSDTSRLISRIKNRQFGIMMTTSYVNDQAYQELLDDGHPIVLITGRNIADYIFNELEIRNTKDLSVWLNKRYPK